MRPMLPRTAAAARAPAAVVALVVACLSPAGATGKPPRAGARLDVAVTDASGRPLADAAVWVRTVGDASPTAPPRDVVAIEQRDREFVPRLTVVQTGTRVAFPNRDQMLHHVYSFSPAKRFEFKLYEGDPPHPVTMDRPGAVAVGCNIHDWMQAHVVVVDTPHFARTDAQGRATIPGLPPGGELELRAWHASQKAEIPARMLKLAAGRADARLSIDVHAPRQRVKPPLDPNSYGG